MTSPRHALPSSRARFDSTRWSIVLAAGVEASLEAADALQTLCESYWQPIYAFARREGYQPAEAQDLTQGFFTMLLQRQDIRTVRPEKGRFRSFLLTALKHFIVNERKYAQAEKRGGGQAMLSLDFESAESKLSVPAVEHVTPESEFHRQWALSVIANVQSRLRGEMKAAGRSDVFDALQPHLAGESGAARYASIGESLGMTEAAVKMAMSRFRKRFRHLLRDEIGQTVSSDGEVDQEVSDLFAALSRPAS